MNRKQQRAALNKQKKRLRKRQREQLSRQGAPAEISGKLSERLDDAYRLIRGGDYDEAEELLQQLDRRGNSHPEVVRALMVLYQTTGDREGCCEAAGRLMKQCPRDIEARIMYAQESMYCGRASIALLNYQEFIERWPDHPHVSRVKKIIEVLVPETERRIKDTGFALEHAFECCCLHEESLALLQQGRYAECVAKCKELLAKAPHFASARNNLALACFQSGNAKAAIATAEETRRMLPDNRFAEVTLAKLCFLSGRGEDAHRLADQVVHNPPTQQDSIAMALEVLAFLGRDEDVVKLAEATANEEACDESHNAVRLHYLAYAKCRLGDSRAAKALWKQSLKYMPFPEAQENLDDLKVGGGHAPWANAFGKWVPKEAMNRVINSIGDEKVLVLAHDPGLISLIPALMDRGDPLGREAAVRMAMADQSPPMIDALKGFAFGSRGPDALRFEALQFLRQQKVIDAGSHRMFVHGNWTDIQLLAAEITGEARPSGSSERVQELMERGVYAMHANDYDTAESALSEVLAEEPGNCTAAYNLCTVWMRRDGAKGRSKAIPRLEQLHREHPTYPFAAIALAQLAATDGKFQRARDLLAPCFQLAQMHTSEAIALFAAQAQIALDENNIAVAKQAFDMLCHIADDDNPLVNAIRNRIDIASRRNGWLGAILP